MFNINKLSYGGLDHCFTDNGNYYTWVVNGKYLMFNNEEEIINIEKFRAECVRKLHILPSLCSAEEWDRIVNSALRDIRIIDKRGYRT